MIRRLIALLQLKPEHLDNAQRAVEAQLEYLCSPYGALDYDNVEEVIAEWEETHRALARIV